MSSIIIAMSKTEEGHRIGGLLQKHGFRPDIVCQSAAEALSESCRMDDGVIICGSHLSDMSFVELADCIPGYFRLIILTKNVMSEEYPDEAVKIQTPFRMSELVGAIQEQFKKYYRRPVDNRVVEEKRSSEDRKYIDKAKAVLMEKKGMSEQEAHRYIQKMSMDAGNTFVETARMILLLDDM